MGNLFCPPIVQPDIPNTNTLVRLNTNTQYPEINLCDINALSEKLCYENYIIWLTDRHKTMVNTFNDCMHTLDTYSFETITTPHEYNELSIKVAQLKKRIVILSNNIMIHREIMRTCIEYVETNKCYLHQNNMR
jgi:N-methylhydantoinase B/oxoprolinase/acetone carboxylase alpha subunit